MHERRFNAEISRLRSPERMALLEAERVIDLCLAGIQALTLLDVGTGSGIFAEAFARKGLSVTGIDPNPEMLVEAKKHAPSGEFLQGTVERIPFKDKSFDLVFMSHVLHESDDVAKALAETRRCATQRVVVLEWPYRKEEIGPPLEHRLDSADVEAIARRIGFQHVETRELMHMILFIFS
jgi:ubiquinone/menaquinone biosynthesis C-methylase UbiE